jgi:hypothetical protein
MHPDAITLTRQLSGLSAAEREIYYTKNAVLPTLRQEVEALLSDKELTRSVSVPPRAAPAPTPGRLHASAETGHAIGRYQVVRLLGRGGMGEVYLAYDPVLEREVAVKLIGGELDRESARPRLVQEARAASRLRHPNIVTIFDAGEHDGAPYIAMEHVPGETLRSLITRRAPLPLADRLRLAEGACLGLAHAHKAGVVHFDVKPDNLMLDESGVVKVLDFGIARVLRHDVLVTQNLAGTLRYMSPEQIEGRALDHRSDVFSLGASIFELITYSPAFSGEAPAIVARITGGALPRLRDVVPDIDPQLDAMVARAMSRDLVERFDDLDELAHSLRRIRRNIDPQDSNRLGSTAVGIPRPGPERSSHAMPLPAGRSPLLRAAAILVALIVGATGFWYLRPGPAPLTVALSPAPQAPPPTAGTGTSAAADPTAEVWRRLAQGDRAGVLALLRGDGGAEPTLVAKLSADVLEAVRPTVERARRSAGATAAARTSVSYKDGDESLARASRLAIAGQTVPALTAMWQALDHFSSSPLQTPGARGGVGGLTTLAPAPPPPEAPAPPVEAPAPVASQIALPPPANSDLPAPPSPRTPSASVDGTPPRSTSAASPMPPVPTTSDRDGVLAAIRRYQEAFGSRDVDAVRRVWPALVGDQLGQLRRTFADVSAYHIDIRDQRIDVRDDAATVLAGVARRIVPRVGRPVETTIETEFRLRRDGRGWIITDITALSR